MLNLANLLDGQSNASTVKIKKQNIVVKVCLIYTQVKFTDCDNIFPLLDWKALNGITVEHDILLKTCSNGSLAWKNSAFVGGVSDDQYGLAMMDTITHNLTAK